MTHSVSDAHKDALEVGRSEARIVKAYLEELKENQPKRGRKRTAETVTKNLADVEEALIERTYESEVDRLVLMQRRKDLATELDVLNAKTKRTSFEEAFIGVVKNFSERRGIEWDTWRQIGVPARVLRAGWKMKAVPGRPKGVQKRKPSGKALGEAQIDDGSRR